MQDRLRDKILGIRNRNLNPASLYKIPAQELLDIHDLLCELHEEHFGAIVEPTPEPIVEAEPEPASFEADLDLDADAIDPPPISPF